MSRRTILIVGSSDGAADASAVLDGTPHRVLREADGHATLQPVAVLLPIAGLLLVTSESSQRTGLITFSDRRLWIHIARRCPFE